MVRNFEPLLIHLSKYWVLRAQLCLTVCNPWEVSIFKCQYLWIGYFQRLLCPWNFPAKNTGVSCCFFLQRIFPTQGSNPCLLILYHWATWEAPSKYWRSPSSQSYGFPSSHVWMWELGYKELSAKELMLLNCGVREVSWEFLGLQGDPTSPS